MSEQSKPGRKPRVTDEEVLAVLRESDDPVLSTAEVADKLPIKRRATLTRLQRLAENGDLARKQTGGRNTVWWLADESSRRESFGEGTVGDDDRTAVEERDADAIIEQLETFIEEGDAPESPLPSAETVSDDYHAHRHRKNLERLASKNEDE